MKIKHINKEKTLDENLSEEQINSVRNFSGIINQIYTPDESPFFRNNYDELSRSWNGYVLTKKRYNEYQTILNVITSKLFKQPLKIHVQESSTSIIYDHEGKFKKIKDNSVKSYIRKDKEE